MSCWAPFGILGVVAGPLVLTFARTFTHDEPLSWVSMTRCGWVSMAAAGTFLGIALSWAAAETGREASTVSWFVIIGLLLAVIDLTAQRLPHRINGVLLAGSVVQLSFLALLESDFGPLLRASLAAVLATTVGMAVYAGSRQRLGFGDVVLLAPVALVLGWFSWQQLFAGLLSGLVLAAASMRVLRVCRVIRRGDPLPLGPFLIAGAAGAILLV